MVDLTDAKGRRLKVRRPPPALRLVEHGEAGVDPQAPPLDLRGSPRDAPLTFMRLGDPDLDAGIRAVAAGSRPDAIVTGLGERRGVTTAARRLTHERNVPWFCDPLLFRTALPGYRTARQLQDLDYTPGRDADPYTPDEFADDDAAHRVAHALVGAQIDLGTSGSWSASFVVAGLSDPWLPVNQKLLRESADAAEQLGSKTLLAGVPLRLMGFGSLEAQRLLVRALAARTPAAFVLMLDGLSEHSGAERIVAAIRLALLFQATGTPVILGRSGDLRRLFWAFGVKGAEFGLGRLLRFAVPDYKRGSRGPGPTPGPRVEIPILSAALPNTKASAVVASGEIEDCRCSACARDRTRLGKDSAITAEHDAHIAVAQAGSLAGVSPERRVEDLDRELVASARQWRRLALNGLPIGQPKCHETWIRALAMGVQAGLLEPQRLASELRLFDPPR